MERKSFVISYDLAEGGNYDELFSHIKSYGYWAHITESTWAVLSTKTASEIRDEIAEHLKGSRLIVVESANEAAWRNVICRNEWLKEHI